MSDAFQVASPGQKSEGVRFPADFFLPDGSAPCFFGGISLQYVKEVLDEGNWYSKMV
jgi:hypothetical protein